MKTILLPVDAADSCHHTLSYVASLTHDKPVKRIILLRSFYVSVYAQLLPSADFVQLSAENINDERQTIERSLKHLAQRIQEKAAPGVKVDLMLSEEPLPRAIVGVIAAEQPTLLVIGSRCKMNTADDYNGDFVIRMAKTSPIPVLIVPADVDYEPIRMALVPVDFSSVSGLNMLKALPPVQPIFHPELMVLNIDTGKPRTLNPEQIENELQHILQNYTYRVYYSQNRHILQGIMNFAGQHPYQMIVALPGRHSFFYNLTHNSITQALTLNAQKPVIILK